MPRTNTKRKAAYTEWILIPYHGTSVLVFFCKQRSSLYLNLISHVFRSFVLLFQAMMQLLKAVDLTMRIYFLGFYKQTDLYKHRSQGCLQGYPQRMRLQGRPYRINAICSLVTMVSCNCNLLSLQPF